jgi:preprotein translocase subunit SecB
MSEQAPNTQSEAQFVLQRIYVKDMSFESPRAPDSFLQQWKPKINMDLNTSNRGLGEDNYEVVLAITITATNEADEVVYLVEVQQAGVFLVRGLEDEALLQTLSAFCPNVLFPYARETMDSIVTKGSFPPLMLAPVNFDAIYAQARAQSEAEISTLQ